MVKLKDARNVKRSKNKKSEWLKGTKILESNRGKTILRKYDIRDKTNLGKKQPNSRITLQKNIEYQYVELTNNGKTKWNWKEKIFYHLFLLII